MRSERKRPEWDKLYNLAEWGRIKERFRAEYPLRACICQAQDSETGQQCNQPATEIDHVIPHKGDWFLFCGGIDFENLQGLCHRHHSEKTALELSGKTLKQRRVIAWCGSVPIYAND